MKATIKQKLKESQQKQWEKKETKVGCIILRKEKQGEKQGRGNIGRFIILNKKTSKWKL